MITRTSSTASSTSCQTTPLQILLAVKPLSEISYSFTEDCPLASSEGRFRLLMEVNARIDEALATIEGAVGEDMVPAYFAAVLLGAHGNEPQPIHLRFFTRPVWELQIRDPRDLVKLGELLKEMAEGLAVDPNLCPWDIHEACWSEVEPRDDYDQFVHGTEPLDLFPERAFALRN